MITEYLTKVSMAVNPFCRALLYGAEQGIGASRAKPRIFLKESAVRRLCE